ncbi:TorF family putative porin [Algiphilus aromaticivorans]|uniref:TorF family putative porin n=1 Tax=Algiphilus aromaticivorans TaxID=382454 RepID=UPI00069446D5|nr:TorF family putative porin [Algiphilus aromaticivorans]
MMKIKHVIAAAALGTATMAPTVASADLSGNAGVMSEYLFRGLTQSTGASVYGGLDYSADSGFYVGTWAATINFGTGAGGAGTEVDVYAGYAGETDAFSYDVGAIYYWYSEEDEVDNPDPSYNTPEIYGSLGFGPLSLSAYYAPDTYFGVDDSAYGVYGSGSFPLTSVLALDAAIGYNGGKGNEGFTPDSDPYIEYNLGVSAGLDNGFGFSFGLVMTDIDDDDPKMVVDASYSFDLM